MFIREAASVLWQTVKDIWEELLPLSVVNLVWLAAWGLPVSGAYALAAMPYLSIPLLVLGVLLFAVGTAGVYCVANRVAHARTFHFSDFIEGVRTYWWRSIVWLLANVLVALLVRTNVVFYPAVFKGTWVSLVVGLWLAVLLVWVLMQVYFWPVLLQQDKPRLLLAWRNALYLILASPFYAFVILLFALVLLAVSVVSTLPFLIAGMTLQALLGLNAALALLAKHEIIQSPRPGAPTGD